MKWPKSEEFFDFTLLTPHGRLLLKARGRRVRTHTTCFGVGRRQQLFRSTLTAIADDAGDDGNGGGDDSGGEAGAARAPDGEGAALLHAADLGTGGCARGTACGRPADVNTSAQRSARCNAPVGERGGRGAAVAHSSGGGGSRRARRHAGEAPTADHRRAATADRSVCSGGCSTWSRPSAGPSTIGSAGCPQHEQPREHKELQRR